MPQCSGGTASAQPISPHCKQQAQQQARTAWRSSQAACRVFSSSSPAAFTPKKPASTTVPPSSVSTVLPAWVSQAGERSRPSSSTASGTCRARPAVATVGPAGEEVGVGGSLAQGRTRNRWIQAAAPDHTPHNSRVPRPSAHPAAGWRAPTGSRTAHCPPAPWPPSGP